MLYYNKMDIRKVRKQLQLTQEQLAQKLGVSFTTVNRWENGKAKPSPLAIKQIQNLLKFVSKFRTTRR